MIIHVNNVFMVTGSSEETGEIVLQKLKENCKYLVDAWG